MKLKIASPTRTYIETSELVEITSIKKQLTYTNTSISYRLNQLRKNKWMRQNKPLQFESMRIELEAKLKDYLYYKDENGLYMRTGFVPYVEGIKLDIQGGITRPAGRPMAWKKMPRFEAYPYQKETVEALLREGHGSAELATGLGKSHIMLLLARTLGLRTVVITPGKSIFSEILENFEEHLGPGYVGCFGDGKKKIKKITVAIAKSLTMVQPGSPEWDELSNAQVIISDECFPYRTPIMTEIGPIEIGMLAKMDLTTLPKVQSYNENTKSFEFKKILGVWKTKDRNTLQVLRSGRKKVTCTDNHPLLTNKGWKPAGSIQIGDALLGHSGASLHSRGGFIPTLQQRSVLIGSYLGDGHISKTKNYFRLGVIHGEKQRDYLNWKRQIFDSSIKEEYIEKNGFSKKKAYRFVTRTFWDDKLLFDFGKKKTLHSSIIEQIDDLALAVWFMDDGATRIGKTKKVSGATLHTESFDLATNKKLVNKLLSMGIACKITEFVRKRKTYFQITISVEGYQNLAEKIYKYIHPCMSYKFPDRIPNTKALPFVGKYSENMAFLVTSTATIQSNKTHLGSSLFDMKVEDNHNFLVGENDGIIAHNCHTNPAETNEKVMHNLFANVPWRFFLSATQTRNDGSLPLLNSINGRQVYSKSISEGIDEGFLSKLEFMVKPVRSNSDFWSSDAAKMKRKHYLYNDEILDHAAKTAELLWKAKKQQSLILVEEIEQIAKLLNRINVPVTYVHGNTTKKVDLDCLGLVNTKMKEEIHRFNSSEVGIFIGTRCVSTGTNFYPTHNTFDLQGVSSEISFCQGPIGRSTRLYEKSRYFTEKSVPKDQARIWLYRVTNQELMTNQLEKRLEMATDTKQPITELK